METNNTDHIEETKQENATLEKVKLKVEDTPGVDLCFMLDCTGSMGSYILMSCNKIKDIIGQVKEMYSQSVIRIGIVAYRDIGERNRFELLPFIDSVDKAKSFLDKLRADGGADTPEDVNGAFQKVLFEMKWENPVRLVVHIADAPCHGKEFHSCDDSYPKGYKEDMDWSKIFKELVELRLDYLFLKISKITDTMFIKFKELADKHGASEYELSFQQELANESKSLASDGKTKAKAEDHFAATIGHVIKSSLHKEMKKGLQNKLSKRIEENVELVNKIKTSVAETVKTLDIEAIRKEHQELATKVGDCILSSNNFIDAIADEDCLCLTFDIGRSAAAIADPTQIIIKNVYPSFLTAGSFFYSTEFALKKNKLAHGGFEKHAEGLILKGAAQENITAVMPLYFCEENWKVAKQLMKLTIGWDVTLDPLGYTYQQIKTVPFLVLAKLAEMIYEKPNAEFLKFQFELVKKTCIKIMEDGSKEGFEHRFNQEVINLYSNYVDDLGSRTIDSIANNSVFLAQLYIAMESPSFPSKGEEYLVSLFKGLVEEELRRKQRNLPDDFNCNEWLFSILNVDTENYIAKPVREFIESHNKTDSKVSEFEHKFLQIASAVKAPEVKSEEKKEETKTPDVEKEKIVQGDPRSTEKKEYTRSFKTNDAYNGTQTAAREDYEKTLTYIMKYLMPLRSLLTSKQIENPTTFKAWDIETDEQFFTLYIQNKLQGKNANRREAFTSKVYRDPWTQAEDFVTTQYNKLIENEKASRITKFITSIQTAKSAYQASIFANTDNLNEAAGTMIGVCVGVDVMEFFNKLCEEACPHAAEKVRMMLTGHYQGVKLYKDADSWTPSRTNANRLLRGNPRMFHSRGVGKGIPTNIYRLCGLYS